MQIFVIVLVCITHPSFVADVLSYTLHFMQIIRKLGFRLGPVLLPVF
jgi:hypothetical protein